MTDRQTNSWGDSIYFSNFLTARQELPGSSSHEEMNWTACYDDDCGMHLHEKEGSGWFPKRRGRNRKAKTARRNVGEDVQENPPWGDSGDGVGCPIPTGEEVKVILARKGARGPAEAKEVGAVVAAGVEKEARFAAPDRSTTTPANFNPRRRKKKQFTSLSPTNSHKKQHLQPRRDQGKTDLNPKPPKISHWNPPVATAIPTAVITAGVAASTKLAPEREEKLT